MGEMKAREAAVEAVSWAETLQFGRLGHSVAESAVCAIEDAGFTITRATVPTDPAAGGDLAALTASLRAVREDICASRGVERDTGWALDERLAEIERRIWTVATPAAPGAATEGEAASGNEWPPARLAALKRDRRRFANDPDRCQDCGLVDACGCGTQWATPTPSTAATEAPDA